MTPLSLKYRIAGVIFLVQAVVLALVIWQSVAQSIARSRAQLERTDAITVEGLAEASRTSLVTEEYDELLVRVARLRADPRVTRVYVSDGAGRVVAATEARLLAGPRPPLDPAPQRYWRVAAVAGAAAPLGEVAVEFSEAGLAAARSAAWRRGAEVGLAGVLLTVLVALALGALLTRRLNRLVGVTRRLAAGEAGARAKVTGTDEVAGLGRAFDEMAERLERQLAELGLVRAAVDQAKDAVMIAEAGGPDGLRAVYVNPAFVELTGYAESEIAGRASRILLGEQTSEATVAEVQAAFRDRHPWQGEMVNHRKDGSEFVQELRITPLRGAGGEVTHWVAIQRDVTERRRTEEALRLAEAQLRQAQKMEAVGRLAGGVAHDFNNLLTVIGGRTELLLERLPAGDPVRRDIETVAQAAARAAGLTRQLLAFSRRQVLEPRVVDPNAIVSGLDRMLRRLIGEDIDLTVTLAPDLGRVRADPGQIEQILLNLCVNSRDAMPDGGRLTIETANVEMDESYTRTRAGVTPGSYVLLAVSDTGQGMNAETQAHVFEPFFTTKERGKGTGLGLATVYGIVSQSGGHVWFYSEVGRGTTFKIYLPRVDGAVEPPAGPGAPVARPGTGVVLLVEDEEAVRGLAHEILTLQGYEVIEAGDAREAIEIASDRSRAIDLLLTDVIMPDMSGPALAARLVAMRPDLRVVYMSGYTDEAIVRHGVLEPGVMFLQKPFTPASLSAKIGEVLASPSPGSAA